jgi:DNA mismatch repair protein MutL
VGKIAVLPRVVQGQIAAGEVIERPASVVRELVENALDAGAGRIDVRLAAGGLDLIAVRDDGEGMTADDALIAFARHATSKLTRVEDLAAVATHGFRGEALPSIAAVGRVTLVTRRADAAAGVMIEADGGGARPGGPCATPPGTSVEVRGLFAATPARRKFLRAPQTEVGHVVDVLTRLAVARPTTGFRLEHDGREVLAIPPVRDLAGRLAQVLGPARAGALVEVAATDGTLALHGYLGPPRETLASARLVWTYVAIGTPDQAATGGAAGRAAGRWVRDKLLLRAVLDGYESLLMRGRYPIAVLMLTVPPGDVDVNVHPAKLEVRFRRTAAVHQLIVPALRSRLTAALRPGAGAPSPAVVEGTGVGEGQPPSYRAGVPILPLQPVRGPEAAQAALWQPTPRTFGALRFVGQLFDGYLLCEGDGKVVLIDQHAAHERVVFERLRAERTAGGIRRQPLLVPEAVALSSTEAAALGEHTATLAAAGLEGEPFGDGTFLLRSVPDVLRGHDAGALLRAMAVELVEEGATGAAERQADAALATVACHSVVRVGQRLGADEVAALLQSMDGVPVAAHCPHGRPVAVELDRTQIEALFRR